jgi:hypothetical protein
VARQKLETVLRVAIKECGYPKDGPHTTTDENLFKLLDHFGIKYGKKQKVKSVAELPDVAIMETRKMPSTGNSHLVVFERTADGVEHALDPGWWLKQQVRQRLEPDQARHLHSDLLGRAAEGQAQQARQGGSICQPAAKDRESQQAQEAKGQLQPYWRRQPTK